MPDRESQSDSSVDTIAKNVHILQFHLLQQFRGVIGHLLEGESSVTVGSVPVTLQFRHDHLMVPGKQRKDREQHLRGKRVSSEAQRQGLIIVLAGVALGLLASLAFAGVIGSMLYGVSPLDATALLGGAILLMAVSLLACYVPAHRAARIDPMSPLPVE